MPWPHVGAPRNSGAPEDEEKGKAAWGRALAPCELPAACRRGRGGGAAVQFAEKPDAQGGVAASRPAWR
jgi:hypothetical protein